MDALYFRVSSERQTTENQFAEVIEVAKQDGSGRDWSQIRSLLARAIYEEEITSSRGLKRIVYRLNQDVAEKLLPFAIYVEQGKSGKLGAHSRPLFERMKHDAALKKFDRVLVWKVTRLGRDMREVLSTVYELADIDVMVLPVKSQTGPITSTMGELLWAIQAWYAEMENEERSASIKAGLARARAEGKCLGRPTKTVDAARIAALRAQGLGYKRIARQLRVSARTVRRVAQTALQRGAKT